MSILVIKEPIKTFAIFEAFDKNVWGILMTAFRANMVYSSDKLHSGLCLEMQ